MKSLKVGDVIAIPVDEARVGLAQVVGQYKRALYFSVFRRLWPSGAVGDVEEALNDEVILLALSFDARLHSGDWRVIGHCEIKPESAPLPAYLEGVSPPGSYEVVDHSGTLRRAATATDVEQMPPRQIVAPIRIENALRAFHGLDLWIDEYERLRVPPTNQRSRGVFG